MKKCKTCDKYQLIDDNLCRNDECVNLSDDCFDKPIKKIKDIKLMNTFRVRFILIGIDPDNEEEAIRTDSLLNIDFEERIAETEKSFYRF